MIFLHLFAALAALFASWADQPAPAVHHAPPAVVAPAPAPVVSQPYGGTPRAHDAPSGRPGPAPQTVAEQPGPSPTPAWPSLPAPVESPFHECPAHPQMSDDPWVVANCPIPTVEP